MYTFMGVSLRAGQTGLKCVYFGSGGGKNMRKMAIFGTFSNFFLRFKKIGDSIHIIVLK